MTFAPPIPSDAIVDDFVKVLHDIGYESDQVIIGELTSDELSMAKVFYAMCQGNAAFQNLPWTQTDAPGSQYGLPNEAFDVSPQMRPMRDFNPVDPFHRRPRIQEMSAPETSFSLAQRPAWAPVFTQAGLQIRDTFEGIPGGVEVLLTSLQHTLTELKYEYFHPNQLQIIARSPATQQVLCLDVEFMSPESVKLITSVSGDADEVLWSVLPDVVRDVKEIGES
jgi:hypothetical protein